MYQGDSDAGPDPPEGNQKGIRLFPHIKDALIGLHDLPSLYQRAHVHLRTQRTPHHQRFGDAVSVLHHESVDAGWEHYAVYPDEPGCQPVFIGMFPSTWRSTRIPS
jgi:hypothetical protein